MPGYLVYNSSELFIMRCRNGDNSPMTTDDIKRLAMGWGLALPSDNLIVIELENDAYQKSIDEQREAQTVPSLDGNREPIAIWAEKMKALKKAIEAGNSGL